MGEAVHVIALRGVAWRSQESQLFRLWQDLARFWPGPFASDATSAEAGLVAHVGQSLTTGLVSPALSSVCSCPLRPWYDEFS